MNYKLTSRDQSPNSVEIERLMVILNQEEQLKNSVEKSYNELLNTSKELEKRITIIDEERNEWKTRYENQQEINKQLKKQISQLENKTDETKLRAKNINRRITGEQNKENLDSIIAGLMKNKEILKADLKDYNWRIEQEMKSYHKANEERKNIHQEILETRNQLNLIKEKNDHNKSKTTNEPITARRPVELRQTQQSSLLPNIPSSYSNSNHTNNSSRLYESPTKKSDFNLFNETPTETHRNYNSKILSSRSSVLN
ncbi:unnamed protein product [Brachionus calyciflorus]|uniref:Uncharacterized protein n=1 Tax=Brachionus calyciflorus TaxID=104777 RepID=A0A813SWR1_9BILA|nr:unnamed protein product [Brachionus calyciflorus]